MAHDQVQVMTALGFDGFRVAGHDRGARVAHRMVLDHPQRVSRLALLDILPTLTLYERTDRVFATAYWEWFFFTQAAGFPEALLGAAPEAFLRHELGALVESGRIQDDAWTAYLSAISAPGAVHGMCEDYRAGASIDLDHDRADLDRLVECPLLVMWGAENVVWERFDMIAEWSARARTVTGVSVPSGHYLAEEAPEVTANALAEFFS